MISRTWNQFPLDIPQDQQLIWVRIDRWSGAPFLGQYLESTQQVRDMNSNLIYPFWVVSAWREAANVPGIPTYPISGIFGVDAGSAFYFWDTTDPRWRPVFQTIGGFSDWDDFGVSIAFAYYNASSGNPPDSVYSRSIVFNLGRRLATTLLYMPEIDTIRNVVAIVNNLFYPNIPPVTAGFRMFLKYQVIHRPTGYYYPPVVESVDVT